MAAFSSKSSWRSSRYRTARGKSLGRATRRGNGAASASEICSGEDGPTEDRSAVWLRIEWRPMADDLAVIGITRQFRNYVLRNQSAAEALHPIPYRGARIAADKIT